jgi:2-iminobutanoate/2-iminopropanoate deaminase
MMKQVIFTDQGPPAVGPYSQAVRAGNLVYTAGQIALDPASGKLIEGGIIDQTRQVLRNLTAILEAAGAGLDTVVKTTVFLQDMNNFPAMNATYGEFFSADPPARSTVEVSRLPLDVLVEIEAVALVRDE